LISIRNGGGQTIKGAPPGKRKSGFNQLAINLPKGILGNSQKTPGARVNAIVFLQSDVIFLK
jgi:hypothetical protein